MGVKVTVFKWLRVFGQALGNVDDRYPLFHFLRHPPSSDARYMQLE